MLFFWAMPNGWRPDHQLLALKLQSLQSRGGYVLLIHNHHGSLLDATNNNNNNNIIVIIIIMIIIKQALLSYHLYTIV